MAKKKTTKKSNGKSRLPKVDEGEEKSGSTSLAVSADNVPDFMRKAAEDRVGLDDTAQFQTVPRIGIVQPQSGRDRKSEFGEGGVAIFPEGLKVADPEEEFIIVPIVFFPTWEQWSDIDDDSTPFVEEVSHDPQGDIARRSKGKSTREEDYGEEGDDGKQPYTRKYVECINVISEVVTGDSAGEVAVLTFSGSSHRTGRRFSSMIRRRPCDLYGNRISVKTEFQNPKKYEYYTYEINNPSEEDGGPFVTDKKDFERYLKMHEELSLMVKSQKLQVHRDGDDVAGGTDGGGGGDEDGDLPPI